LRFVGHAAGHVQLGTARTGVPFGCGVPGRRRRRSAGFALGQGGTHAAVFLVRFAAGIGLGAAPLGVGAGVAVLLLLALGFLFLLGLAFLFLDLALGVIHRLLLGGDLASAARTISSSAWRTASSSARRLASSSMTALRFT